MMPLSVKWWANTWTVLVWSWIGDQNFLFVTISRMTLKAQSNAYPLGTWSSFCRCIAKSWSWVPMSNWCWGLECMRILPSWCLGREAALSLLHCTYPVTSFLVSVIFCSWDFLAMINDSWESGFNMEMSDLYNTYHPFPKIVLLYIQI